MNKLNAGKNGRGATKGPEVARPASSLPVNAGRAQAPAGGSAKIDENERRTWIERSAYYRAESRGFGPGGELDDWIQAEADFERLVRNAAGGNR
jgi:hypothetical protein